MGVNKMNSCQTRWSS